MLIDGVLLRIQKFESVLDEQTTIALLSQGAISIAETNEMPPSDRRRILNNLLDLEEKRSQELNKIKTSK